MQKCVYAVEDVVSVTSHYVHINTNGLRDKAFSLIDRLGKMLCRLNTTLGHPNLRSFMLNEILLNI